MPNIQVRNHPTSNKVSVRHRGREREIRRGAGAIAAAAGLAASAVHAQITTDGSLGPRMSFIGNSITISFPVGRHVNGNLFHSFQTFNVDVEVHDLAHLHAIIAALRGADAVSSVERI